MLREQLHKLGLREGDWLGVFGDVETAGCSETALDDLIAELAAAVGRNGYILVPTFTCGAQFDRNKTPAATGRFAERFRRWPGVVRSNHPAHSVAVLGPAAHEIIRDHDVYLPFRPETPLGQLAARGGKALLLGGDHRANALIHVGRLSIERDRPVEWINVETVLEFGGKRRRRYVAAPCDWSYTSFGEELESAGLARQMESAWGKMIWMTASRIVEWAAAIERNNPRRFLCGRGDCRCCAELEKRLPPQALA
ncbi:MAG: AAC(3) family N-acetyltransferase [Candidatus Sumerlaeia bacterium]|nr:AAC(3) family N-acetyltransferase [Candidatus Sumerlaeia bacterium]